MSFSIKRILFTYKIRNILIELLTHLYLQGLSSFSIKPCALIIYQNACSNSKISSIAIEKNYLVMINTIILTISLGSQMGILGLHLHSNPSEDPLIPYGLYLFEWINECPYTVDHYGLHFGLYGSKPLIRVGSLHDIYVGDQIFVVLIVFNRIISRIKISKYLSDRHGTLPDLLNGAFTIGFRFDLIKSSSMCSLDYIGSSTYRTS